MLAASVIISTARLLQLKVELSKLYGEIPAATATVSRFTVHCTGEEFRGGHDVWLWFATLEFLARLRSVTAVSRVCAWVCACVSVWPETRRADGLLRILPSPFNSRTLHFFNKLYSQPCRLYRYLYIFIY